MLVNFIHFPQTNLIGTGKSPKLLEHWKIHWICRTLGSVYVMVYGWYILGDIIFLLDTMYHILQAYLTDTGEIMWVTYILKDTLNMSSFGICLCYGLWVKHSGRHNFLLDIMNFTMLCTKVWSHFCIAKVWYCIGHSNGKFRTQIRGLFHKRYFPS